MLQEEDSRLQFIIPVEKYSRAFEQQSARAKSKL